MRVQFALCSQTASVDRASNRLSIFNVIDHLPVTSLPIRIPMVTFVSVIESADAENTEGVNADIDIYVDDKKLFGTQVPLTFADHHLARFTLAFQGIPVSKPGEIVFRLSLSDGTKAESRIRVVNLAPKESLQVASSSASTTAS